MSKEISNQNDLIDSRDVIERIQELQNRGAAERRIEHPDLEPSEDDEEELRELDALLALAEEAEGYSEDWPDGATLIRDSYFVEYAQQLAEDIGCIDRNGAWPADCINWERAAEELQMDYTQVDFDDVTYWVR